MEHFCASWHFTLALSFAALTQLEEQHHTQLDYYLTFNLKPFQFVQKNEKTFSKTKFEQITHTRTHQDDIDQMVEINEDQQCCHINLKTQLVCVNGYHFHNHQYPSLWHYD